MIDRRVLSIEAAVTTNEAAIMTAAAAALTRALTEADGTAWSCGVQSHATVAALPQAGERSVINVISLLEWLTLLDTPWAQLKRSIRSTIETVCAYGHPVMLLTILRHVAPEQDRARSGQLRIRIRRLNLLATEISRELGALVIDLDRVLADLGARRLRTDYRLGGREVRQVAGRVVALCIVANTLDDLTTPEVQTRARDILVKDLPAVDLPLGATSNHLWTVGQGVRRQTAAMTEIAQANEIAWVLQQVLKRQISPVEALRKLVHKIGQRGVRAGARRVSGALRRLARSRP